MDGTSDGCGEGGEKGVGGCGLLIRTTFIWKVFGGDGVFGLSCGDGKIGLVNANTCLSNFTRRTSLGLNWEKCHFTVKEGKVLGHKISEKGIEVDRAKIEVVTNLAPPNSNQKDKKFLGSRWVLKKTH
ncbi:uncharacterized protein LOC111829984 [Capsella rubella]|uniref:uncharacterized protein LOC111829984 n=1 Tax=Capsella rubella TaxID=81985 RepID=UPI000CD57EC4|nr:uncharacterized protein LOC111829984 [Capsella rubella]